jgi:RTX calcium-binding nonapeptide repeat (4 copies)
MMNILNTLSSICLTFVLLSSAMIVHLTFATNSHLKGRTLPIPDNPITPPPGPPVTSLDRSDIAPGLELPKNLVVPSCSSTSTSLTTNCPPVVGTDGPDIIIASYISGATIYGLNGNDIIQCGSGNCKVFGGPGDNMMIAGSSTTAQFYGGSGNNVFVGGTGNTLMVGGKGDDQLYAGSGNDILIGGGGSNYFDCGANGNAVILDFNAKNSDTKASNCKYTITVKTGVPPLP